MSTAEEAKIIINEMSDEVLDEVKKNLEKARHKVVINKNKVLNELKAQSAFDYLIDLHNRSIDKIHIDCELLIELIRDQYRPEIVSDTKLLKEWMVNLHSNDGYSSYFSYDVTFICKSASKLKAIEKIIAKSDIEHAIACSGAYFHMSYEILFEIITEVTEIAYDDLDDVLCV